MRSEKPTVFFQENATGGDSTLVLATHFSYAWLFHNDSFGSIGTWSAGGPAPADPLVTDVVTSSPKGIEFATSPDQTCGRVDALGSRVLRSTEDDRAANLAFAAAWTCATHATAPGAA
jgi:hypothetical protein